MGYQSPITEADLILDESFNNWVKRANHLDELYWEEWVVKHPEKEEIIENARNMVLSLSSGQRPVPETEVTVAWIALNNALIKRKKSTDKKKYFINNTWYAVATVFVSAVVSGWLVWQIYLKNKPVYHRTQFGETMNIYLPDSSLATLNGNTSLQYTGKWTTDDSREVWLEGEAYFSVKKGLSAATAKFIVHTTKLDIEVLGTQFNVSDRRNITRVILDEGEVKINPASKEKSGFLILKPGELVEYTSAEAPVIRKLLNSQMYSAWKYKKMVFEETTMQELAQRIEATYGLEVVFKDNSLTNRKLSGTIPSDNIDVLLLTLSKLFSLDIHKNSRQIIINSIDQ